MTEQTKHDRIFLQIWMGEDAAWATKDRLHEDDVEYIRADLVAEQITAKNSEIALLTKQFTDMSDSVSIQRYNNDINELRQQLAAKDVVLLLAKDALNKWGQPHGVEAWMEARAAIDKELEE